MGDDAADEGVPTHEYSVTRWFRDAQQDFAARLRWAVTPEYSGAKHHPRLSVSPGVDIDADAGEEVTLVATAVDPDGGDVDVRWWQYLEAGTYRHAVELDELGQTARLRIPSDAQPGQTIHVIVEARGGGEPGLKAYRRVIITIR